jgi:hypothetical protein
MTVEAIHLGTPEVPKLRIIKELVHRAGINADVLSNGRFAWATR